MKRKGSITVFAALSFMLIAQMLFTLLEVARYHEFEKVLPIRNIPFMVIKTWENTGIGEWNAATIISGTDEQNAER